MKAGATEGSYMEPQPRYSVGEDEAVAAELVDRIEYQEAELERMRSDLETVRAEREARDRPAHRRALGGVARQGLELADLQLKEARPLYSRIGNPDRP